MARTRGTRLVWLLAALAVCAWACESPKKRGDTGQAPDDGHASVPDAAPKPDAAERNATDAAARDAASAPADAAARDAAAREDAGNDAGALALPTTLADTGLYAKGSTVNLGPGVMPYTPRYVLWSDSAEKQRWLFLPKGSQIDTSDMDFWRFPIGTKAWKQFTRDAKKVETRFLWRTAQGWFAMAFAWNEAESEAVAVPKGVANARGTAHDIPARDACASCHEGVPDRLLGVSAIQLAHGTTGLTLSSLAAMDALSDAPSNNLDLPDTTEWNALGYLHANCGSCHNPMSVTFDRVNLDLWLRTATLSSAADTPTYKSLVGVPLTDTSGALTERIARGDADHSGLILRMMTRGSDKAMPPLASELPDDAGLMLMRTWINGL